MSQALSVMGRSAVQYLYADADIVIRPQIDEVRPDDLSKAAEMIAAGEEAARRVIDKIKRSMGSRKQGLFKRIFSREPEYDKRRLTMLSE
jgi:predicted acylesterase/phospholipase RssA